MRKVARAGLAVAAAICPVLAVSAEAAGPEQLDAWRDLLDKPPANGAAPGSAPHIDADAVASSRADGDTLADAVGVTEPSTRGAWGAAGGTIRTNLSGGRIVPGPGDSDGTGSMLASVSPARGEMCYLLSVQNLTAPTVARISEGGRLRTGVPMIALAPPVGGASAGCIKVAYSLALRMVHRPWDYYVDVVTEEYPQGAIRGQVGQ